MCLILALDPFGWTVSTSPRILTGEKFEKLLIDDSPFGKSFRYRKSLGFLPSKITFLGNFYYLGIILLFEESFCEKYPTSLDPAFYWTIKKFELRKGAVRLAQLFLCIAQISDQIIRDFSNKNVVGDVVCTTVR